MEKTVFYNLIKNINFEGKIDQDHKNECCEKKEKKSLRKKITSILNDVLIDFTINSKSDILINPFKIRVLIVENNFNLLLYYFRNQGYSKFETILFFSNIDEQKALMHNTSIKKLQKITLFYKDDLESFRILLNQRKNLLLTSF